MAEDADRELLRAVATRAKDPKQREAAAAEYRQRYGEDASGGATAAPAATSPAPASPAAAAPTESDDDSPQPPAWDRFTGWFGDRVNDLGSEIRSLGALVGVVKPDARDTERLNRLETFGERASNALTLGASRGVMDLLGASSPQRRKQLEAAEYPLTPGADGGGAAFAGDLFGNAASALMGPARMVDQTARTAINAVAPRMANTVPASVASGVGSGVALNAAANASDGKPLMEGAGKAAAIGGVGTLLGEAAGGMSRLARREPWVGRYASAKERGVLQEPDVVATRDSQEAAEHARGGFDRRNAQLEAEAGAQLGQELGPHNQHPMSRRAIQRDIFDRMQANLDNTGRPIDPRLDASLQELSDAIGPASVRGPGGQMQSVPDPTYESIRGRRTAEREASAFGSASPTDAQMRARQRYSVLGDAIDRNAPPEARAAERRYAASAAARRGERDIVYRTEERLSRDANEPDLPVSREVAGARFFRRVGDRNIPGTEARTYHEQLAAADPEYAALLQRVVDIKAREAMRPGIESRVAPTFHGALAFGGITPALEQLIFRPALGRLVEPSLARAARILPQATPRLVPLLRDPLDAFRESRRRQAAEEEETP